MPSEDISRFISHDVSDERVDKLEVILKKEGHNFTHDEVHQIASDMVSFYSVLADGYEEFEADQKRLKKEPGGWIMENPGHWFCRVCGRHEDELWYEAGGFRCQKCKDKGKTLSA